MHALLPCAYALLALATSCTPTAQAAAAQADTRLPARPREHADTLAAWRHGCQRGDALHCHRVAVAHHRGRGALKNWLDAWHYYEVACEGGHADACVWAALGYLQGEVSDTRRALALLEDGCSAGAAQSCSSAAALFDDGGPLPNDPTRALSLYERACRLCEADACTRAGEMHFYGHGTPRDREQARGWFRQRDST